jgi:hypothetical protein
MIGLRSGPQKQAFGSRHAASHDDPVPTAQSTGFNLPQATAEFLMAFG